MMLVSDSSNDLFSFDVLSVIETWNYYSPISPLPRYLVEEIVSNVSRNSRHYGGILVLIKASVIEGYERINSKSENLLRLYICFKCEKQLSLEAVHILSQNSSYNQENTREILEK